MVSWFFEPFRILMSVWIFLVFSSFRELLCASHCGTLHSDGGPWRTIHHFGTFPSKIYLWRERGWCEWYCDTSLIECDFAISHYFRFASCAVFHLYHGDWGSIFLPDTYTHLPDYVMSLPRRPLYYLHQDVTIFVRFKNISQLISTYSLSGMLLRCHHGLSSGVNSLIIYFMLF